MTRTKALFNDSLYISLCQLLADQTLTQSNALSYQPLQLSLGGQQILSKRGKNPTEVFWKVVLLETLNPWERPNFLKQMYFLLKI